MNSIAKKQSPKRPTPRSALRLMQIIEHLARDTKGLGLAALSKEISTPKSSALNILRSMVANGYVANVDGQYQLGPESYRLASSILASRRFPEITQPIIAELVKQTGETAVIGQLSEDKRYLVYIAKSETSESLRFSATIGDRRPLHLTAGGLILLAYDKSINLQDYLKFARLNYRDPDERLSLKAIKLQIDAIIETGFAVNSDLGTRGVTGIGAPIFDDQGIIAALSIAIPSVRVGDRLDAISAAAVQVGREISMLMGGYRDAGKAR